MGTIAENLLALQQTKNDIKTAIESKGQDLTDVPFTEYPNKINAITTSGAVDKLQYKCDELRSLAYEFYATAYNYNRSNNTRVIETMKGIDTSKVLDMQYMFGSSHSNYGKLTDLSSITIDMSLCNYATNMFIYQSKLTKLPKLINVNSVRADSMFKGCKAIVEMPDFEGCKFTNTENLFEECYGIKSYTPKFDMSESHSMSGMFKSCIYLKNLDVSNLNTGNVTNMNNAFYSLQSLGSLDLSSLDTSKVQLMSNVFYNCGSLIELNVKNLNTSSCTNLSSTFASVKKLSTLDLTGWDTSKVTTMSNLFAGCENLETVIGVLDCRSVTSSSYLNSILMDCYKIKDITFKNIRVPLQIGAGVVWGHLLTLDSLLNTIKELWDLTGSTKRTLTMGSVNLEKLANVYVKLIDITDEMRAEDEYIDNKKPFEVCESTDTGAMLITEYVTSKNWQLA